MYTVKVSLTRRSVFYLPVLLCHYGEHARERGIATTLRFLSPAESSRGLLNDLVDVAQSSVSASWVGLERGEDDGTRHFAQINSRDGFFLVGRANDSNFKWSDLSGSHVLADQDRQPITTLRYAMSILGIDAESVRFGDAKDPESIVRKFQSGEGDFAHLQGPAAQVLEETGIGKVVGSLGAVIGPIAFSSLRARVGWLGTPQALRFREAYAEARERAAKESAASLAGSVDAAFPGVSKSALESAVTAYQQLGCWKGAHDVETEGYATATRVFYEAGAISRDHPYEKVVS